MKPREMVRNCKGCKLLFRVWRGSSTRCPDCWKQRKEEREQKRSDRRKRDGDYPKPETRWWNEKKKQKNAEVENCCEVCSMKESECKAQFGCGLTRDHLLPVRFIMSRGLGDPNLDLNIKLTCSKCGGLKTAAEVKLFNGDVLGFLTDLKKWNWNMEELQLVLKHYRFYMERWDEFFGMPVRQR